MSYYHYCNNKICLVKLYREPNVLMLHSGAVHPETKQNCKIPFLVYSAGIENMLVMISETPIFLFLFQKVS